MPTSLSKIATGLPIVDRLQDRWISVLNPLLKQTLAEKVEVPLTSSANGVPGQWAVDASFFYVCVSTNNWMRIPLAAW